MQETICAQVNPRLLTKADRLFTGTVEGRIIEILQNARRAGATEIRITNEKGFITVEDNGSGIEDFQKLLDLGGSGWDERIESGEDPAGVGLFSLAPRNVTIASGQRQIVIEKDGWTGQPVPVTHISPAIQGTRLKFQDETPWGFSLVEKYAVFTGLKVIVDGQGCHSLPFCGPEAVDYPQPGCRIEVTLDPSPHHRAWMTGWYHGRVLVNFHGQVVQLDYFPGESRAGLHFLVDISDQTDIRLMLPARTQLVENPALAKLKAALEIEYYRYFQRQTIHTLHYAEYLRAQKLGIKLPEAQPQYKAGLLWDDSNLAVEVPVPKEFKLQEGYLYPDEASHDERSLANAHLLAALGHFEGKPFVPVTIGSEYMGYSWTQLPTVTKVKARFGKERLRQSICSGDIACYDHVSITVDASDGKTFGSEVAMAIRTLPARKTRRWSEDLVCVTKEAQKHLSTQNIWYHLGGYSEDGDSFDTQLHYFDKALQAFWNELAGPHETLRQQLFEELYALTGPWQKIILLANGHMEIHFKNGRTEAIAPPAEGM